MGAMVQAGWAIISAADIASAKAVLLGPIVPPRTLLQRCAAGYSLMQMGDEGEHYARRFIRNGEDLQWKIMNATGRLPLAFHEGVRSTCHQVALGCLFMSFNLAHPEHAIASDYLFCLGQPYY